MSGRRAVMVNGQEVNLEDNLTAADLKRRMEAKGTDVVVVRKPDGFHRIPDNQLIPADAERLSIVPQFRYGLH